MAYTTAPGKQMAALFVADFSRLPQIGIRGNCAPNAARGTERDIMGANRRDAAAGSLQVDDDTPTDPDKTLRHSGFE
jgi:hypothetical protein